MVHNVEGDFEAARERFEEARSLFEQVGDSYGLASVLCLLSRLAAEQGDVDGATASWCQAFELLRELGDSSGIIIALSDLCAIQLAAGRPEAAVRLAGAAEGLGRELKVRPPTALTRPLDPRLAARTRIGEAAVRAACDAGAAMTLDQAVDYALELTAPGATSQAATGEA
jgi:tetratricopeptide (TPR) repeat protein